MTQNSDSEQAFYYGFEGSSPVVIDLNAERKRRAGLAAERDAANVPDYCERCWHRPYLHRRGDADCGVCGCPA
jgi:hypothetical protein